MALSEVRLGVTVDVGKGEALPQAQRLQSLGFAYFHSHTQFGYSPILRRR